MAFTLSNLISESLLRIGLMTPRLATGGSTTTIVDSNLAAEDNLDEEAWKNGFAVVLRDAGGASAAPEGEFQRIISFTASSGTITVDTAFTVAPASGDRYGFTAPDITLEQMKVLANLALRRLGDMPQVDTTTLDTVAGDTEYAAAVAWKRARPLEIAIQGRTGDAQDNQWEVTTDWDWVEAAGGTAGKIIFNHYPVGSRDIRVRYIGVHPTLNAYSDVVNERINPDIAINAMILEIRNWQVEQDDGEDTGLQQKWNKVKNELTEGMALMPADTPRRQRRKFVIDERRLIDRDTGYYKA